MADNSVTLELTNRQMSAFQSLIAKNISTFQGMIFISCEMFQVLHDIDANHPLLKRWNNLARDML